MNFNFSKQPEYELNTSLARELINLYGVQAKLIETDKISTDSSVFGDFSHMKSSESHLIYVLPENTEEWDNSGYAFASFGLVNMDNITLFVAKKTIDDIGLSINKITSNLLVFPNNKIMEITDTSFVVPGVNNLFTYNDAKSVYKLICKPYSAKLGDEIADNDTEMNSEGYESLDNYFNELISIKEEQDNTVDVIDSNSVNAIVNNVKIPKPVIDKTEVSPFGEYD